MGDEKIRTLISYEHWRTQDGEKVAVNTKRRKLYCLESSRSAGSPAVHTWDLTYACTRLKILNDSVMRWAE